VHDGHDSLSFEFVAEIAREPSPDEDTVTFRYVGKEATEIVVAVEWWDSLGRPKANSSPAPVFRNDA
jgi:hypothetical protein